MPKKQQGARVCPQAPCWISTIHPRNRSPVPALGGVTLSHKVRLPGAKVKGVGVNQGGGR